MNRRGPLIAGVVSGIVALLTIVMLVLPKMNQVSSAHDELSKAMDQDQVLQGQLRALQDAQAAAPQTKAQIAKLENLVPPTADEPGLIRIMTVASDRAAVDFFTMSPGTPTADPSGTFSTISTQVNVTGSYFSVIDFLYRLETLQRAAKVINISLSPGGGETTTTGTSATTTGQLAVQLTVEFYTTDINAGPGSAPAASPIVTVPTAPPTTPSPGA